MDIYPETNCSLYIHGTFMGMISDFVIKLYLVTFFVRIIITCTEIRVLIG